MSVTLAAENGVRFTSQRNGAHHVTSTPASVGCTNANPWEFVVKALPLLFVLAALAACSGRPPAVDAPAPAEDHAATTTPATGTAPGAKRGQVHLPQRKRPAHRGPLSFRKTGSRFTCPKGGLVPPFPCTPGAMRKLVTKRGQVHFPAKRHTTPRQRPRP